ncbi:MAG: hypothetical protein JSR66_09205 [Proteobacteria bacterium]|nr:hypothetical protein [Pseudomonadota bacterium]
MLERPLTLLRSIQNLRRWSRLMSCACILVAMLFVVRTAQQWITLDEPHLRLWLDVQQVLLTPARRLACLLIALIPSTINAWGLMRLSGAFAGFASGESFTPRAIARLRDFAAASTLSVLTAMVSVPVIALVVTYGAKSGLELAVNIGTGSLTSLLVSGVVWLVVHVLALANAMEKQNTALKEENGRLASENAQFI